MSKKHYVNCTINNQTSGLINYTPSSTSYDLSHGEFYSGPISVEAGDSTETFNAGSSGGTYGITGWVQYVLPDGATLTIMFNNPYTHDGSGYTGNQWLYACINGYSKYFAVVDSSSFLNPVNPLSDDTISPTVTIYEYNNAALTTLESATHDTPTGNYVSINFINQTGNPFSLNALTNQYDSPPVTDGNPPYVAETIPAAPSTNTTPFLAVFADGGAYQYYMGGQTYWDYPETNGTVAYNMPDKTYITISWSFSDEGVMTPSLGGTGANNVVSFDSPDNNTINVTVG